MGTPAPIVTPGNPCVNCWGVGKTFGPDDPPVYITCEISDVIKGPTWVPGDGEPTNGRFTLTQSGIFPCQFELNGPDAFINVEFAAASTIASALNPEFRFTFGTSSSPGCSLEIANTRPVQFIEGKMVLTLPGVA